MNSEPSAASEVFEQVRTRILSGELAPGTRHSIYQLAASLSVSRTPVREAVLRLADAGLLTIERNRGFVVRGVQAVDVAEVFELRALLEVPAAAAAARAANPLLVRQLSETLDLMRSAAREEDAKQFVTLDRQLHATIGGAFDNRRLTREVDRLRDSIQVRGVSTIGQSRSMSDIAEEHVPIVEAIASGNPDAAAQAMRAHLSHTASLLLQAFG